MVIKQEYTIPYHVLILLPNTYLVLGNSWQTGSPYNDPQFVEPQYPQPSETGGVGKTLFITAVIIFLQNDID